jgi:extradiol dioxygenase family protein
MSRVVFHLAFPINDVAANRFYADGLGCVLARS